MADAIEFVTGQTVDILNVPQETAFYNRSFYDWEANSNLSGNLNNFQSPVSSPINSPYYTVAWYSPAESDPARNTYVVLVLVTDPADFDYGLVDNIMTEAGATEPSFIFLVTIGP